MEKIYTLDNFRKYCKELRFEFDYSVFEEDEEYVREFCLQFFGKYSEIYQENCLEEKFNYYMQNGAYAFLPGGFCYNVTPSETIFGYDIVDAGLYTTISMDYMTGVDINNEFSYRNVYSECVRELKYGLRSQKRLEGNAIICFSVREEERPDNAQFRRIIMSGIPVTVFKNKDSLKKDTKIDNMCEHIKEIMKKNYEMEIKKEEELKKKEEELKKKEEEQATIRKQIFQDKIKRSKEMGDYLSTVEEKMVIKIIYRNGGKCSISEFAKFRNIDLRKIREEAIPKLTEIGIIRVVKNGEFTEYEINTDEVEPESLKAFFE